MRLPRSERVRADRSAATSAPSVNLGQIYLQQRRYAEALALLRAALAAEPYNVTAAYNLALALTRAGKRDEGRRTLEGASDAARQATA